MSHDRGLASIVIDLDDTLLDTHRQLVPVADRLGVATLIEHGLPLSGADALAAVAAARARGVWEVFADVARSHGLAPGVGDEAMRRFLRSALEVDSLALPKASARALDALSALAPLVLLTVGDDEVQRRKIALLGIAQRFDEICVASWAPGTNAKLGVLAELVARRGWRPHDVLVVGDRIDGEIVAGNQLGCRTVWVRGGECAARTPRTPDEEPWRTTSCVSQVAALLGG